MICRQTDIHTNKQIGRRRDRQAAKKTDRLIDEWTNGQTDTHTNTARQAA
jgi:hypothetical protein